MTTQMNKYAVNVEGMSRHVFTARDIHEAQATVDEWGYHHKLRGSEITLSVARADEQPMADEFMGIFRQRAQKAARRMRRAA